MKKELYYVSAEAARRSDTSIQEWKKMRKLPRFGMRERDNRAYLLVVGMFVKWPATIGPITKGKCTCFIQSLWYSLTNTYCCVYSLTDSMNRHVLAREKKKKFQDNAVAWNFFTHNSSLTIREKSDRLVSIDCTSRIVELPACTLANWKVDSSFFLYGHEGKENEGRGENGHPHLHRIRHFMQFSPARVTTEISFLRRPGHALNQLELERIGKCARLLRTSKWPGTFVSSAVARFNGQKRLDGLISIPWKKKEQ